MPKSPNKRRVKKIGKIKNVSVSYTLGGKKKRVKPKLTTEEIFIFYKINTITLGEAKFLLKRYYSIE